MDIGILGSGIVGRTLGSALVAKGHRVRMGSRTADNADGAAWVAGAGAGASQGTFADAAAFGEVVLLACKGEHALAVAGAAGDALAGKVLIDITNPLDFSRGFPPSLTVANTDSLAEHIQRAVPAARVVKALNTVSAPLMVDPGQLAGGEHTLPIAGNDPAARAQVKAWLGEWFGWRDVVEVGGLDAARGTEAWLLLWTRLYGAFQTPMFNLRLVRG